MSPPTAAVFQHHTFPLLFHLFGPLSGPARLLLLLLLLPAAVEVLHHHADEHVEHEEADQQQEGDEVHQTPLGVVLDRLPAFSAEPLGGVGFSREVGYGVEEAQRGRLEVVREINSDMA